ncbi:dicarboxylate diiron protein, putative [Actinidia rufa]|uniref:magnesium-protoporphyrin IX monomethyl ester (oxidative) cyclase n=1 Tax=Actinidia rufa TaxID=165716 RepID=A0A7J0EDW6_9ERIC|nr:dicarboxylate diiron protein, putative [Actinidia rufa]
MAAEIAFVKPISKFGNPAAASRPPPYYNHVVVNNNKKKSSSIKIKMSSAATTSKSTKKVGIKETLLTPRFYTTDFDEMERLFNTEINQNLNQAEFEALLQEFKTDYNQTHFVRNKDFKEAADKLQGPLRQIFVEFLERSCTAEFSGFLLYKELGRRLKKTNPVVAEIFSLMSRDEARHAGFLNKGLSDFNLALDLGFLTKARKMKTAMVYVTMYLNDCQRTAFYEGIGLNTKEFDIHVIIETNRTTARIFPAVPDVENPEFKRKLDRMVEINEKLIAVGEGQDIPLVKNLKRIPLVAALASQLLAAYLMPPIDSGSVDFAEFEPQVVY